MIIKEEVKRTLLEAAEPEPLEAEPEPLEAAEPELLKAVKAAYGGGDFKGMTAEGEAVSWYEESEGDVTFAEVVAAFKGLGLESAVAILKDKKLLDNMYLEKLRSAIRRGDLNVAAAADGLALSPDDDTLMNDLLDVLELSDEALKYVRSVVPARRGRSS